MNNYNSFCKENLPITLIRLNNIKKIAIKAKAINKVTLKPKDPGSTLKTPPLAAFTIAAIDQAIPIPKSIQVSNSHY